MMLRRLSLALLFCGAIWPSVARAQAVSDGDKAAARQLAIDGLSALEKKDFAAAADLLARADKLFHAPTVTLGLARAQVGLGKLLAAQELYHRLAHDPLPPNPSEAFIRATDSGRSELSALTPRIPALVIQVRGGEAARVLLDGVEISSAVLGIKRPVDPGRHVVRVSGRSGAPAEATVTLVEGKVETVTLELSLGSSGAPEVPEASAPRAAAGQAPVAESNGGSGGSVLKPIGFAAIGVGAAGLVAGAVTAGLTASKRSSLLQQCPSGHCSPSQAPALQSDVDSMHTLSTVSTAGFIAGGVLAAAGVVLVVAAPKARAQVGLTPIVGPGFAGLKGSF